ncbi:MAG: PQQ-binding-like beta-propeller repeat protein [Akkermansiaceae bacterium]
MDSGSSMMKMAMASTVLMGSFSFAVEWTEFRGGPAQGVVSAKEVPVKLDFEKDVLWKTPIPGKGWSSPVMSEGFVVVTSAVKTDSVELRTFALDASSGEKKWETTLFKPDPKEAGTIHSKNTLASSSALIADGVVYAHFGHMGTAALELKTGKVKWRYHETYHAVHGNGGSPVLVDGVLIFSADGKDKGLLRGLDAATGKKKWEVDRQKDVPRKFSFGTPFAVKVDGEIQVVSQGSGMVGGYRPKDGQLIWSVDYGKGYSVVPRPIYHEGRIYVTTGFDRAKLMSIRLRGAKGDITKSHVDWIVERGVPHTPSMVLSGDEIFMVDDTGRFCALDRKTGERLWRDTYKRKVSASLTLVGNKLYAFTEEGQGFVHEVSREGAKEVAVNEFEEPVFASPIIFDGTMIVRSQNALWRFGKK